MSNCTKPDCVKTATTRGLCPAHYQRLRRSTDCSRPPVIKTTIKCHTCGVLFERRPCDLRKSACQFCSRACFKAAAGEAIRIKKPGEGVLACKGCGAIFRQLPSRLKSSSRARLYCSDACRDSIRGPVTVYCKLCSKPSVVKRYLEHRQQFCDRQCMAAFMSQLNRSPRARNSAKGGFRSDLGLYVRSSWEANYARYLNWLVEADQIAAWEYEPDTFQFQDSRSPVKVYTPDFKVFGLNGNYYYHEIKGYLSPRSQEQIAQMRSEYAAEPLILIDSRTYKGLEKAVARYVPNWEGRT